MEKGPQAIEDRISDLKLRIADKIRERGEAVQDDVNSWHDNSAFDLINEELLVLRARLRALEDHRAQAAIYEMRSHR
jgi:hypothetical protein